MIDTLCEGVREICSARDLYPFVTY